MMKRSLHKIIEHKLFTQAVFLMPIE